MIIGFKDLTKLLSITVVVCCAVFVCTMFLNYNIDLAQIKDAVTGEQAKTLYDAQVATGKVVVAVTGGSLVATTVVMLVFYVKNYIDTHGKELGILKALGYSRFGVAIRFWVFGISVLFGTVLGFASGFAYMPTFYRTQNGEGLFPDISVNFHFSLFIFLIILPTVLFILLAVLYSYFKMKIPVLNLIKEVRSTKVKKKKREGKELPFLKELKRSTLTSKKTLVFFIWFSAFCFSAMTQMSVGMYDLASEDFAWIMITIGLILAFMTLFMSLTSVVKANMKTIAMMKVYGYTQKECSGCILGSYRPISYIGFVVGTAYQYLLLKIVVELFFADFENIPEFHFNYIACLVSLAAFVVLYELIIFLYSKKLNKLSVKSIMLE